jgi:UDP-glucose 4-epimerase
MSKRKALVTGCCGFIGSALVHSLLEKGWDVEGVDDTSAGTLTALNDLSLSIVPAPLLHVYKSQEKKPDSFLVINGDFTHENVLDRIKEGCYDVIFHLAAYPDVAKSIELPVETHENNVFKTIVLFHASIGAVERIVFASSAAVYGNADATHEDNPYAEPTSPYGWQKLHCENYASLFGKQYNLDVVCLRYFNVFGPGQVGNTVVAAWCNALHDGTAVRSDGDGNQSRDFCYVDNVVDATILAANYVGCFGGRSYNVGTGISMSNNEILSYLQRKYPAMQVQASDWRPGDIMHSSADITRIQQELEYEVGIGFHEGLEKTLKWWGLD